MKKYSKEQGFSEKEKSEYELKHFASIMKAFIMEIVRVESLKIL